jgi:hypothetical protein
METWKNNTKNQWNKKLVLEKVNKIDEPLVKQPKERGKDPN